MKLHLPHYLGGDEVTLETDSLIINLDELRKLLDDR